ncbi:ATP-binding protein [Phytoactinopolyspora halotolerans]|uniref:ATP-binding protein n=1 Tax=Phytoactinopolyspora halotolerans TaxID=1981512 RepID=A0A6L9SJC2_9ACTN|nr:ATP-binding protein [Phytoactinopolyspora halotolerans]NEE04391.1 ATP-binding protein [Phytoactinopolyspora halotolerans]
MASVNTDDVSLGRLVPRRASAAVEEALSDTRVVVINGARQSGKSTLARQLIMGRPDALERRLDRQIVRQAAIGDPATFIQHDGLLLIDEVQRVPELLLEIKDAVDLDPRPGRYLLTGSARILGLRDLPDALPGRMEVVTLWPFSQGEICGTPDAFVDAVFARGADMSIDSDLAKGDYAELVARGGYPEAVARIDPRRRGRFFSTYVDNLIDRDIRELTDIEYASQARRLLRLLAARTGQLLVMGTLASELGLAQPTIRRYIDLLEQVYLVSRTPAWSSNLTTRAVATPKVLMTDSGLASHLLRQSPDRLMEPDSAFGPLLEAFVTMEITKQLTWSQEPAELFHFRTRDKLEVDIVLENPDGQVVGIEVKAGATVRGDDFRGLRYLSERLGDRLVAGIVMHTGSQTLPFGPKLRAMPISALWTAQP